jgi:hypothetical protein
MQEALLNRAVPGLFGTPNEKAARSIMEGGLFETKAMPEHRPLAGL